MGDESALDVQVRIRRRITAPLGALMATGLPVLGVVAISSAGAANQTSWTVYAGASGSDNVTPITNAGSTSPTTGTPFGSGNSLKYPEITPDGSTVFVNSAPSTIQVFTTSNNALVHTITGDGLNVPMGMAVTPDGTELWVGNFNTNNVMVICITSVGCGATAQYGLITTVPTGNVPIDVSITPDGSAAYVSNFNDGTVSVISTSTFATRATLTVARGAHYTTFTPDGKFALEASCGNTGCDNATGSGLAAIQNPETSPAVVDQISTGTAGSHAVEILPNCVPSSCKAYMVNYANGTVSVITNVESTSPSISNTITGMSKPRFLVATPDSKFVYVGDASTNDVYQISTATNAIINTISSPTMHIRNEGGAYRQEGSRIPPDAISGGLQGFAVTPDQAPVALLSVTPEGAGQPTSFDASASSVTIGTIATFAWNFGDGSAAATTTTPTTTHTYSAAGNYTATVTETSSGGTSAASISTGHQILAHGSSVATASKPVTVGSGVSTTSTSTTPPISTTSTSTTSTSTTSTTVPSSTTSTTAPKHRAGYWMLDASGNVYGFGSAGQLGSATGIGTAAAIAPTPDGGGYWIASAGGQVRAFGDAPKLSLSAQPVGTVVTIVSTLNGKGFWLATNLGQVVTAGDAHSFGDLSGKQLNSPIVNMAASPQGGGYWLLGGDGGVFTFGTAGFFGSTGGIHLNQPAVAMAPTLDGNGYWFVASDGGIFAYGDAPFFGSMGGIPLAKPVNGMVVTFDGQGYWMAAADGGVFTFGDAGFVGSLGGQSLPAPIVGFAPCNGGPTT